jgi:hypothetical protein
MTTGLLISRQQKLKLQKLALTKPCTTNTEKYTDYRNIYNKLLRLSKKMYFEKGLAENEKNPKKTWDILKEATNICNDKSKIEKITVNNNSITDPKQIANEFNNFFSKIGIQISESVTPTIIQPEDYLTQNPNITELEFHNIGPNQIVDIIKLIAPKNSLDIDGISANLVKQIAHEISIPLSHVFSLSMTNGVFPARLKTSRTVPIFKTGNMELCDNYRPIALLSTISKILEKIVSIQLVNHLDRNELIYKHQYGFQKNKSTEHNLTHAINFIGGAMNEGKFAVGIFFDLKKAFDVCSHNILLKKLKKMGVNGTVLSWFSSYLSGRKQCVDIDGVLSDSNDIIISILQGSILGPILFLCYINDLHNVTDLLMLMFADDTFCLKSDYDINNLIAYVNREINKMAVWFRANKLAVNVSKTKYIIFRTNNKKINDNLPDVLFNENEPNTQFNPTLVSKLERYHDNHEKSECRAYKLLGIYLDEHLNFNYHVKYLCNKLVQSLYCIKQAKNILTKKALRALYFALIHSHLTYCPIILSCINAKNRNSIGKIQKKAIRTITNSTYNEHTGPLFKELRILPYDKLIVQAKLHFMHSIKYNYAPRSFDGIWVQNNTRQQHHELRNSNDYILPRVKIEFFRRIPLYSLPYEWNNVGDLIFHHNKNLFRNLLREKLLNEL